MNSAQATLEKAVTHHVIVGAGLIGSYLGCVLLLNKQTVQFVARGQWIEVLSGSVRLTDFNGNDNTVSPDNVAEPAQVSPPADIVWLTVKCTAVTDTLPLLKKLIGPDTLILCCQNGLGSHAPVVSAFPDNEVWQVMVPFNVVLQHADHLHRGSEGSLIIGAATERAVQVSDMLSHDMLPVETTHDIRSVLWAKLQLNLGNSVNALCDKPVKAMLQNRYCRRVIAMLMQEWLDVAKAKGVQLPKVARVPGWLIPHIMRLPDWLFTRLAGAMLAIDPTVKTSMWWDLSQGKLTEIEFLNGAVVKEAQKLGLATPVNLAIMRAIREAEEQNAAGARYSPWTCQALYKLAMRATHRE